MKLEERISHIEEKQDSIGRKVDDMHEVLTKARGLHWGVLTLVAVGGFLASKLGAMLNAIRP